jgi:hypothetical protein
MSYDRNKPLTCASCGVPWIEHRGPQAICAELQTANKTIADLRATVGDLQADIQHAEEAKKHWTLSEMEMEIIKLREELAEAKVESDYQHAEIGSLTAKLRGIPFVLRPTGRTIPDLTGREHVCEWQSNVRPAAEQKEG